MLHDLVMKLFNVLDDKNVDGYKVRSFFEEYNYDDVEVSDIKRDGNGTNFVKLKISGKMGNLMEGILTL